MIPSLPTELLKMIFRYATYAGDDPYQAVTHTTSNLFDKFEKDNLDKMKTKIAITRASRRFRQIALEFLFEFVSINKPKQAATLVKMMKKHSSKSAMGPGEWIKFLFATCCTEVVTEILHLCCGLVGFSWDPSASEATSQRRGAAQDEMMSNIPTNIRFLRWNSQFQLNIFAPFLRKASASLQVLYTHGIPVGPTLQQPAPRPSYPSLTHLHVVYWSGFDWLDRVILELPSLIELSVFCQYLAGDTFPEIFRNASMNLRVLRLGYYFQLVPQILWHILDTCANLEEIYYDVHLEYDRVLHETFTPLWALDVTHMTMKKIGVTIYGAKFWNFDEASSKLRHYFGPISKTRFPSLDTIIADDASGRLVVPKDSSLQMRRVSEDFTSAQISVVYNFPSPFWD